MYAPFTGSTVDFCEALAATPGTVYLQRKSWNMITLQYYLLTWRRTSVNISTFSTLGIAVGAIIFVLSVIVFGNLLLSGVGVVLTLVSAIILITETVKKERTQRHDA